MTRRGGTNEPNLAASRPGFPSEASRVTDD